MSSNPNVILMVRLTPSDLSRKTMRKIFEESKQEFPNETTRDILIAGDTYHAIIMEIDYDESWQISGKEGDLIFFDLVTYDYGDSISWNELQSKKESLEQWAQDICERFNCSYEIAVSANYW